MISVIVPVYNSEKKLAKCLESILGQTYTHYEIIVVNDGSTDNSAFIIEHYAEKDSRINAITKTNGGVSSARNVGIEASNGEYICFVDSDDYVVSTYLDELYNCITRNDADSALCLISRSKNLESKEVTYFKGCDKLIISILNNDEHNAGPYNKLFKRELIGNLRFAEDIYLGEDTLFCVEYAKKCMNAVRVNKVLYYYDIPTSSTIYVTDNTKLHRNLSVIESRKRMLEDVSMLKNDTIDYIVKSYKGMCSYNASLGVSYNNRYMLRIVAEELGWAKKNLSLHLTSWEKLLVKNNFLYYICKKFDQKSDALCYHIKGILK